MLQVLMSTFVNYISGLPEIKSATYEDTSGKSEVQSAIGNLYFINKDIRNPFFADRKELLYYSPEVNIKPDTPPFFIWQTNSDDPRNSFTMGSALTAMSIPFEMHLFPEGVHGLALADGNNDLGMAIESVAQWANLCVNWLNNQKL